MQSKFVFKLVSVTLRVKFAPVNPTCRILWQIKEIYGNQNTDNRCD